jgi:hypothetical protein
MPSTRKTIATIDRTTSGLTRASGELGLRRDARRGVAVGVRRRVAT